MSAARVSRRRLKKLQDKVDLALEGDARFFERLCDRSHRLRVAGQTKVDILKEVHGADGRVRAARSPESTIPQTKYVEHSGAAAGRQEEARS